MSDDLRLIQLLRVVQDGDDANTLVDNAIIADRLGWDLAEVATCLTAAKERSLIWGQRTGDKAAMWFSELEVTVQGRRLLRSKPDAS